VSNNNNNNNSYNVNNVANALLGCLPVKLLLLIAGSVVNGIVWEQWASSSTRRCSVSTMWTHRTMQTMFVRSWPVSRSQPSPVSLPNHEDEGVTLPVLLLIAKPSDYASTTPHCSTRTHGRSQRLSQRGTTRCQTDSNQQLPPVLHPPPRQLQRRRKRCQCRPVQQRGLV